jgi:hypothetical protein
MAINKFYLSVDSWHVFNPEIYNWFESQPTSEEIDWWTARVNFEMIFPICINGNDAASTLFKLRFAHLLVPEPQPEVD